MIGTEEEDHTVLHLVLVPIAETETEDVVLAATTAVQVPVEALRAAQTATETAIVREGRPW